MIDMFITNGMSLSFYFFFVSCSECPMSTSSEGSSPVQSGGSLFFIITSFRCRKFSFKWETLKTSYMLGSF